MTDKALLLALKMTLVFEKASLINVQGVLTSGYYFFYRELERLKAEAKMRELAELERKVSDLVLKEIIQTSLNRFMRIV